MDYIERFQPRSHDNFEFDVIFKSFPICISNIKTYLNFNFFFKRNSKILNLSIIQFAIFQACKIFPESPYLDSFLISTSYCSSINIESDEWCEIKREYISARELSASLESLHRSRPVPYDLSFSFSPSSLFTPSLPHSLSLSTILGQPRRDEVRGRLKYADFYRRPRAVNERMGEPGMKNEKGLDHKGCGRPDFTGRRVLGNYRTFKVRKGSVTHYPTLDTSIVKSSTLLCRYPCHRTYPS